MREHPILFSGPMVRAILEGRKTQTRRVIRPQPCFVEESDTWRGEDCMRWRCGDKPDWPTPDNCPYGERGDRLWVRETWYYEEHMHDLTAGEPDLPGGRYSSRFVYRASQADWPVNVGVGGHGWRPSIHMHRFASRITLEITEVRVQQLQDITEGDARAEGAEPEWRQSSHPVKTFRGGFATLWDSINAGRGFSWVSNPWVWVVSFRDITSQAKAEAA